MLKFIIYFVLIIILLVILLFLFTRVGAVFGGNEDKSKLENSSNYENGKFHNLVKTNVDIKPEEALKENEKFSFFSFFFPPSDKNPKSPLPSQKLEAANLENNSFAWLGHSTILMKLDNKNIITDPVFNKASPIPFTGAAFGVENPTNISDLPKIDVVIISHDHYDHLDYESILELGNNVGKYLVPLGVKSHLLKWGIDENRVEELDWYDELKIDEINFVLAPGRHFSGRNIDNRNSTLWGGWIVKSTEKNVYFTGDTGYFDEFKKIGENYGPFDIAFIESGAYNKAWAQIHMFPEQSVQVGVDLKAELLFPIHWAKFDLAHHKWNEPINRFTKEAENRNLNVATPLIGEIFSADNYSSEKWWKNR